MSAILYWCGIGPSDDKPNIIFVSETMAIYQLYIYTRTSQCIYHHDYTIPANTTASTSTTQSNSDHKQQKHINEQIKLLWGMTYSLKDMLSNLQPNNNTHTAITSTTAIQSSNTVYSYTTAQYKLYYLCTITGYRVVLLTSCNIKGNAGEDILYSIYKVLVDTCILVPSYTVGNIIDSQAAQNKINNIIVQSPIYNT